jgi:hypothetical protein
MPAEYASGLESVLLKEQGERAAGSRRRSQGQAAEDGGAQGRSREGAQGESGGGGVADDVAAREGAVRRDAVHDVLPGTAVAQK